MEDVATIPNAGVAVGTAPARTRRDSRRVLSPAAVLTVGTLASGVLAYAFNLLAARALGPAGYGPIAVLWAAVFLVSVVLFRPVEQTLARELSGRIATGDDARVVVHRMRRLTAALTALAIALLLAFWGPVTDRMLGGHDALTASLALGIAGYAVSYYVRGIASGVEWLAGYGVLLFVDGFARVAFALPLVFVASSTVAAAAIAAAAFAGALAPLAVRRLGRPAPDVLHGRPAPDFRARRALRFAAPVAAVAAAEQVLVSGGALLVSLEGGAGAAAAAGTVFAATMLVRAPVFLFQGVAAALLPNFTRAAVLGERARIHRMLARLAGGVGALTVLLVAGALALGPELMRLVFGPEFDVGRTDLAILCGGVGSYLVAATLGQAAMATDRAAGAALVWCAAAAGFVALVLALPGDPFHRVSVAFTAATALAGVASTWVVLRRAPSPSI
jgi:O-antigen/teichoic acid export membrane protein